MPARHGQPLVSFRRLGRSRLGRLYGETFRRLQRCPVGAAVGDASGISRGSLSGTAGGLIGAARQFLTSGDSIDTSPHLLLTGGDPVDVLPNCVDIAHDPVELLLIGDSGG